MTTIDTESESTVDGLADKVLNAAVGAAETLAIYLGDRLGWYDALAERGPMTPGQLARATGTDERYAREWLEAQAVGGYLAVEDADEAERRYRLGSAAREVFTGRASPAFLAPLARLLGAAAAQLPALVEAYREGTGVSWAWLGPDARTGQADMNRPWYEEVLPGALAGVPALHERLGAPGARIADVGCGEGWSSVALARAYPDALVDGYDADAPSVAAARVHASGLGVDGRARFLEGDLVPLLPAQTYDVVFAFECLHDLPRPVESLAAMRRSLRPDGAVIVMDEATADAFGAPGDTTERMLYGFSTLICLPDAMSHRPTAATGTVMRASTLRGYAAESGFAHMEVLPITDFGFWRFYLLSP